MRSNILETKHKLDTNPNSKANSPQKLTYNRVRV